MSSCKATDEGLLRPCGMQLPGPLQLSEFPVQELLEVQFSFSREETSTSLSHKLGTCHTWGMLCEKCLYLTMPVNLAKSSCSCITLEYRHATGQGNIVTLNLSKS